MTRVKINFSVLKITIDLVHEYISPVGIGPLERRLLHKFAEDHKINSFSKGDGIFRCLLLRKEPRPTNPELYVTYETGRTALLI